MTKLEENNVNAQIALIRDILSNINSIEFTFTTVGTELYSKIQYCKFDKETETYSIKKEDFSDILSIIIKLKDKSRWDELGILNKKAVPDNVEKIKILNILQG